MADKQKFEKMLELLINEDREGAEELFHEIVVEQSRSIYETILEDDLNDDDVDEGSEDDDEDATNEADDDEDDESDDDDDVNESADDDDEIEEDFDLDEFEVEADPTDDMMGDVEFGSDEGDDDMDMDGGEGEIEDRVEDLEDALDDLKAEFDKMMDGGDDDMDMDMDMGGDDDEEGDDDFGGDDEDDDDDDDDEKEEYGFEDFAFEDDDEDDVKESRKKSDSEVMREYVDKIAGKGGLDSSNSNKSEAPGTNTKSTVASKNDMGGTASNILRTDTEDAGHAGAGGKIKGSALNDQNTKEDNAGNVNVPGGKAARSNSNMSKGHGAEKKGAADAATNKKSLIGSKK